MIVEKQTISTSGILVADDVTNKLCKDQFFLQFKTLYTGVEYVRHIQ